MMVHFEFPYGKGTISTDIEEERVNKVLIPPFHTYYNEKAEEEIIEESLLHPIGTARLQEQVKGKKSVVIISSDHTRPVPSKIIMPLLLKEIRSGNPDIDITILIATGCHRETTRQELEEKFGTDLVEREKIIIHNCDAQDDLKECGRLPSGGRLLLNKLALETDLLIAEGFIEPHFFAGFSGGRKSILPGIAGRETVLYNHNAQFIDNPNAKTGVLKHNPVHEDMIYAAKRAGLAFIINVILDSCRHIIYCVSGDYEKAHMEGVNWLKRASTVKVEKTEVVLAANGGYPLDRDIYQAVKGMTAAEAAVKDWGVIIMLAQSIDGHGGESFYKTFYNKKTLAEIAEDFIRTPREKTVKDQWQSQIFCRILRKASIIYVSDLPDDIIRNMRMIPEKNIQNALCRAEHILRKKDFKINIIPDGVSVIVDNGSTNLQEKNIGKDRDKILSQNTL